MPVPPSNEFKMDPAGAGPTAARSGRYQRDANKTKFIWIGVCVVMTLGLVAAGIVGSKALNSKPGGNKKDEPAKVEDTHTPAVTPKTAGPVFPRRILLISVTKYMYLNPLTQSQPGAPDRTKSAAMKLAFDWQVPTDKDNNQVFVLSDTVTGADERLPMKSVVQGTYQEFFKTSRGQDRIVVYFGGHAIERGGKAYIASMEAELDGDDWEKSLIPLEHFYGELARCKATQKVVIWDVCRLNPEKGKVRPGSEPMSEGLYKALSTPPAGVQAVLTCKAGENAMEYSSLRPDGNGGPLFSGSVFLDAMKFVAEPKNNRIPKTGAKPVPADPLPIAEWTQAIAKRTTEMAEMAERSGSGGKQTVALVGAAPAAWTPPDPAEHAAIRFPLPLTPKGPSVADIRDIEREFHLPPLKAGLNETALADFPFSPDVMKQYADDGVSVDTILKDKEKYRFRAAVLDAMNEIRNKWSNGAGATKIRTEVTAPIDDKFKIEVKKENDDWATDIIKLDLKLSELKAVADLRKDEPKRWQAHYDFALAAVKARLAYMNEYNKLLGNLITETLPALDAKAGQDGYTLIASDTLKSGKDIKKMADEAQELFQEITVKYKGTPWALQAKQEKSVQIGLAWKAISLKRGE